MAAVTMPSGRVDAPAPAARPGEPILVVEDIVKRFETPDGAVTAVDHVWRTVIDNVAFPLEIAGMAKAERYERARHFVGLVGLDGFERRYPAELSGGMRQRVSMARTLAAEPKIMLMDEPFASLDEQTRLLLGDKVLAIQQQLKQTTLLITHNITEAVQLSDRILVMTYRPGKLKRMVEIKLPRPRTSEIVSSEAFGRYVAQIWSDLREEASRGMHDDEAAKLRGGEHP